MNIYEINKQYSELISELYENGGEITPEIQAMMDENNEDFDEKIENYMKAVRNLESDSESFKNESKFYDEKSKRSKNTAETLKKIIVSSMEMRGMNKRNFGNFTAALRKSKSVKIDDEFFFDGNEKYIRRKITEEADKKAIKEAIENGIDIVGAKIEENTSLNIK